MRKKEGKNRGNPHGIELEFLADASTLESLVASCVQFFSSHWLLQGYGIESDPSIAPLDKRRDLGKMVCSVIAPTESQ